MEIILRAFALALLFLGIQAQAQNFTAGSVTGAITTQNLAPTGTATTGSCVAVDMRDRGVVTVGVAGTYTGALSGQVTTDGSVWGTMAPTPFAPLTALGTPTATITSTSTGQWQVTGAAGFRQFRVCGLAAMTGTATITLNTSAASIGSSGGGGGGGGAVTAADGSIATIGTTTDVVCATDTGTCSQVALLKKIAQNVNTVDTVAAATLTNVAASATTVTCLASNASRKGAVIVNDSATATAYVKAGATASTTSFTFKLEPGATLTLPNFPIYTGILDCIWSAASGSARVTEF